MKLRNLLWTSLLSAALLAACGDDGPTLAPTGSNGSGSGSGSGTTGGGTTGGGSGSGTTGEGTTGEGTTGGGTTGGGTTGGGTNNASGGANNATATNNGTGGTGGGTNNGGGPTTECEAKNEAATDLLALGPAQQEGFCRLDAAINARDSVSDETPEQACESLYRYCMDNQIFNDPLALDFCELEGQTATCTATSADMFSCFDAFTSSQVAAYADYAAATCESLMSTEGRRRVDMVMVDAPTPEECEPLKTSCPALFENGSLGGL